MLGSLGDNSLLDCLDSGGSQLVRGHGHALDRRLQLPLLLLHCCRYVLLQISHCMLFSRSTRLRFVGLGGGLGTDGSLHVLSDNRILNLLVSSLLLRLGLADSRLFVCQGGFNIQFSSLHVGSSGSNLDYFLA